MKKSIFTSTPRSTPFCAARHLKLAFDLRGGARAHGWNDSDEEQGGGEAAQIHAIAADGHSLFGYQLLARPSSLSKS